MKSGKNQGLENQEVLLAIQNINLKGNLAIPQGSKVLVLFAHGSGSSRLSPRNNYVAGVLQKAGLATLLFDLLTEEEDAVYETRFNIALLAERLEAVTQWIIKQPQTKKLKIGYFGASTGTAAALKAAADLRSAISAVVSRGGRPDLAMEYLPKVTAPTLLIVGGNDESLIDMNEVAFKKLQVEKKLEIIPGATHLFEEPGALEKVALLAANWFKQYLVSQKD